MIPKTTGVSLALCITWFLLPSESGAQTEDDAGDGNAKVVQRWMEYYRESAQKYDIRLNSAPDETLKALPNAI